MIVYTVARSVCAQVDDSLLRMLIGNRELPRRRECCMLAVADNLRYLLKDRQPFFYLGDTAWELFHRLSREESDRYLHTRAAQRFTVIQAVALAELDGVHVPNAYGHRPLHNDDPAQPNEAYWAHVDWTVARAAELGFVVGLLPTWGDKVVPHWGVGPRIFNADNAFGYGLFLGRRYRDRPIIWILGGDRVPLEDDFDARPVWRAMADGIRQGVAGPTLISYHPPGPTTSATWLHDEPWLDFNMMQSGHGSGRDMPVWEMITRDYQRQPCKPVLDAEPNYEDHPVDPWPSWNPQNGYFRDHDVRKQVYRSVFAGGCGVTYGHHSVWQFYTSDREPITYPEYTWTEALDRPAAWQMRHLRALIESRPLLKRVPDQTLLASDPGSGADHLRATRADDGSYALIYSPSGCSFEVDISKMSGTTLHGWWFDPRSGAAESIGHVERSAAATFIPPSSGPDCDWVLVLDDAAQGFAAPGAEENAA
jgi:hypothetical protein